MWSLEIIWAIHTVHGWSMSAYILEIERLYHRAKLDKMDLPDSILPLKMLDNASLDGREHQIVLSVCQELKYEGMKSALRRIFGGASGSSTSTKIGPAYFSSFRQGGRSYSGQHGSTPYRRGVRTERGRLGRTERFLDVRHAAPSIITFAIAQIGTYRTNLSIRTRLKEPKRLKMQGLCCLMGYQTSPTIHFWV